jgi:CubicO group peptidase (beta-lactamase class C family)
VPRGGHSAPCGSIGTPRAGSASHFHSPSRLQQVPCLRTAMPQLLLVLVVLSSPGPVPAPSQAFVDVDSLLALALPKDGGGVLRVAQPSRVLFEKAYGGYRLEDAIPIASGTQLLSVVVLLHLVDAQKLALDAQVSSVLRDWPPDKAAITLRMLLAHTSGLPPTADCLDDRSTTLEACVRKIAATPLRTDPGMAVLYGGAGFQVAGRMAEVATGKSWAELFREHLTVPLGLRATGFGRTANPRVAGGAQSSAGDYGKVLDLLLQGGETAGVRLLSPASVEAMFQDQSGGAPLVLSPYALFSGREASRPGLGLWLDRTDGHGHGLEAVCQGTFGFTAWMDRERQLGGVLLVRSDLRRVVPLEQQVRALFRRAVPPNPGLH